MDAGLTVLIMAWVNVLLIIMLGIITKMYNKGWKPLGKASLVLYGVLFTSVIFSLVFFIKTVVSF